MSASWLLIIVAGGVLCRSGCAEAAVKTADVPSEPKLLSAYPFTSQPGASFIATVRGTGLRGATAVFAANTPLSATIEGVETEVLEKPAKIAADLVRVRFQIDANAKPGRYSFRLVTPRGVSNA